MRCVAPGSPIRFVDCCPDDQGGSQCAVRGARQAIRRATGSAATAAGHGRKASQSAVPMNRRASEPTLVAMPRQRSVAPPPYSHGGGSHPGPGARFNAGPRRSYYDPRRSRRFYRSILRPDRFDRDRSWSGCGRLLRDSRDMSKLRRGGHALWWSGRRFIAAKGIVRGLANGSKPR